MRRPLELVAPAFVAMAHRIGMAVVATVDAGGAPRTRVMQPVWTWDGATLTGVVSTTTDAPKVRDLAHEPRLSATYWTASEDTCTADCLATVVDDPAGRAAAWDLFIRTPPPAGFDPAIHHDWETPTSPTFAVLRLTPGRLRVVPGTLMTEGRGDVLTWRATG